MGLDKKSQQMDANCNACTPINGKTTRNIIFFVTVLDQEKCLQLFRVESIDEHNLQ